MKYTSNTIRINILFLLCVAFFFGCFFVKTGYVALNDIVEGTDIAVLAENRATATKVLKANRGNIYDSSGNVLAQNVNSYTVIAYLEESRTTDVRYPKHVVDKEMTAEKLSEVLLPLNSKMTKEYILKLLNQDVYQVELGPGGRGISELIKQRIEALVLPGIDFTRTYKRYYQNGDFASYIVGYAKKYDGSEEMVGELGIEGFADRYLKGTDGSITYQKDAHGYQMAGKVSYETPAKDGYDIYLTLDKTVQMFLDNAVADIEEYNPEWISITVADADTGAIIASSTSPSFDPNKLNITDFRNPLISYTYEPGSTMKIFSFMTAIEENKYDGESLYKSGSIPVSNYVISDWNKVGWGKISFDVGFTYSSNVAAVLLANEIGRGKLMDYYTRLGFGTLTGIELANEYDGVLDIDEASELAAASYGHGMTVTPIQMIKALTVLTNDGTVLKPYVIDKIIDPNTGKVVYEGKRTEVDKVYSTSTVNKIIDLMDKTVNTDDKSATGRGYATDAVRLIGKTGTANYIGEDGTYVDGDNNVIRSFAGVFPKENPEYIIYVATKDFEGSSSQLGSVIKTLVESVAKYKDLDERPSDKDLSKIVSVENYRNRSVISSVSNINSLGVTSVVIGDGDTVVAQYPSEGVKTSKGAKIYLVTNGINYKMPDVLGWSSMEIINLCNLLGLDYQLNGYGYVISTNIKTDAIIKSGQKLIVDLKNIEPESLTDEEDENENENNEEE